VHKLVEYINYTSYILDTYNCRGYCWRAGHWHCWW